MNKSSFVPLAHLAPALPAISIARRLTPRAAGRLASVALAVVLLFLTSFALGVAFVSNQVAAQTKHASEVSDYYAQARYAVGQEESLERKYRLEPGPQVAAKYQAAVDDLVVALRNVERVGDTSDRALVTAVLTTHERYLTSLHRMFAAVDTGNTLLVNQIDTDEVDPAFATIDEMVNDAAAAQHQKAIEQLGALERTENSVLFATPLVFAVGVLLLGVFWYVLRVYQQRLDAIQQRETQREVERIRSVAERDAAESASRAKSAFLAHMSHELRTPLTAILGYSQLVHMTAQQLDHAQLVADSTSIQTAGHHLLSLINDVLDLSKIQADKMPVFLEPVPLDILIDMVVVTAEPLFAQRHNTLRVECAGNLGTICTDTTKVRQVLLNLLSNAAKFSDHGIVTLQVYREQVADIAHICMRVIDTGIGISAEQVQRIFDPFVQAETTTAATYGGTGLGLALSQRLCELLGGSINVTSALGEGSTFTVILPDASDPSLASGTAPASSPAGIDEIASQSVFAANSIVLVVDAHAAARVATTFTLEAAGFCVVVGANGQEGLELAGDLLPDLLVLDPQLTDVDGEAFLSALANNPDTAHIPIVLFTNDMQAAARLQYAQHSDAAQTLQKNLDGGEALLQAVRARVHSSAQHISNA